MKGHIVKTGKPNSIKSNGSPARVVSKGKDNSGANKKDPNPMPASRIKNG